MKLKISPFKGKLIISVIILMIIFSGLFFWIKKDSQAQIKDRHQKKGLNQSLGPELEQLPNNTVIYLAIKDSFVIPKGYKIDSQIVDKSILIYPANQTDVQYNGLKSLESFKGIDITSAHSVQSEEEFIKTNQDQLDVYKKINPQSNITGQITKDKKGNKLFLIKQTKPFKMIETVLNKEYIIEIASFDGTDAYKKIIDSYNASELITSSDHKAIFKLQKDLVVGYENHDPNKVFSLLSLDAQKKNPIEKIKKIVADDIFKDMISLEPTALLYFDQNFILQSKVIFPDNFMKRVDISLRVDFDGKTNNWSIDSYIIRNKEQYLSNIEIK